MVYVFTFQRTSVQKFVDDDTTGPTSFSGQIGKKLTDWEKLLVANFETINSEEINVTKTDLCKDQQYIINIYRTLKTGECARSRCERSWSSLYL